MARAVRMYRDRLVEDDPDGRQVSQRGAREEVGELLGINPSTLRNWIRRDDERHCVAGSAGQGAAGAAGGESLSEEVARLRKENAKLRRANDILRTSSAFFAAAELDRQLGS
jgi:transposase